ncbi:MAG TPA: serine/threonine-protein kinase [Candidatus Angelobacter sp.]|jgi:serine/threonine protein kinase|nr:serine/threonine-protein kinase [Candidatus Angelobacter sp.]
MTQQSTPQQLPTLRDYEVDGFLAAGSTGTFYTGKHRLTGHPIALQRIAPQLADTPGFVDRLGDSARQVAALRNPHIVGVYDLVVEDGVYLVLELVPGASLRQLAPPGQALPPAAAIAAVDDVLNALETAHQAGIVHGDIRAEHVLITPMGTAKLGGFAVAHALQVLPGQQGAGRPGYASPERLAGRPPEVTSDLYAVSALASEMMTGSTPSPGRVGPPALPAVADVLRRGLSADASRRYGSATELRTALIGATAGSMGPAWRLASDLGARAAAASPGSAAAAAAQPVPPAPPLAAGAAPPQLAFSTPPPPASAAAAGGAQPSPMARPPVTPPTSYLPPPEPRARAAITEVDSEDRHRPGWLIPLIVVLVALLAGGGIGAAFALGAFGGGSSASSGPLIVGTDVKLAVTPTSGGCNTVYNFVATGSVSGAGTLTYRWERSDGFVSQDIPVTVSADDVRFELPGPPWRISGHQSQLQMTFHVVKPTERVVSATVPYSCP